jgi:hypothetical protein
MTKLRRVVDVGLGESYLTVIPAQAGIHPRF